MRNRFDRQLEKLNTELINMGALCEDAMTCAVHAIFDKDEALIEKAEERERQIDQMERDVENLCMRLLLQQQPVARDLRIISSALKMISDMERIGDCKIYGGQGDSERAAFEKYVGICDGDAKLKH